MTPIISAHQTIKVFKLSDAEYWAGESMEACVVAAMTETGLPRDEVHEVSAAYELAEDEMETHVYVEGEDRRTFAEQLQFLIIEGVQFPVIFAVTQGYE